MPNGHYCAEGRGPWGGLIGGRQYKGTGPGQSDAFGKTQGEREEGIGQGVARHTWEQQMPTSAARPGSATSGGMADRPSLPSETPAMMETECVTS